MRKLKPCPFCGGKAHLEDLGWPHHVYCEDCGVVMTSTKYGEDGEDEACEKWNRRACRQQGGEATQPAGEYADQSAAMPAT